MSSGLAARLKIATATLHSEVERAGLMAALLRGQLPQPAYCALLRNLHPIYVALEAGLTAHAADAALAPFAQPLLIRAPALEQDLGTLHGERWQSDIALAVATREYLARLHEIDRAAPRLYLAHAYVRYLGDLAGGQLLRRIVRDSYGLEGDAGTRFYVFASAHAPLACALRAALDTLPAQGAAADALTAEAQLAFRLHARLFEELAPVV